MNSVEVKVATGVHESLSEFTDKTFANSPEFAGKKRQVAKQVEPIEPIEIEPTKPPQKGVK